MVRVHGAVVHRNDDGSFGVCCAEVDRRLHAASGAGCERLVQFAPVRRAAGSLIAPAGQAVARRRGCAHGRCRGRVCRGGEGDGGQTCYQTDGSDAQSHFPSYWRETVREPSQLRRGSRSLHGQTSAGVNRPLPPLQASRSPPRAGSTGRSVAPRQGSEHWHPSRLSPGRDGRVRGRARQRRSPSCRGAWRPQ